MDALVFDTGPLRHFAQAGWLVVLEEVVGERRAIVPRAVLAELESTSHRFPEVADAVDAAWVTHYELSSFEEITAYAMFSKLLVSGRKNLGEAEVLALAATLRKVERTLTGLDYASGRGCETLVHGAHHGHC